MVAPDGHTSSFAANHATRLSLLATWLKKAAAQSVVVVSLNRRFQKLEL